MTHTTALILLLGGASTRAKLGVKKQYFLVEGTPVFMHALECLLRFPFDALVIVCPKEDERVVTAHLPHALIPRVIFAPRGDERVHSAYNGMRALISINPTYVFIHDGARPIVEQDDIANLFTRVKETDAAILAAPSTDAIKIVDNRLTVIESPDRNRVYRALTPQAFRYEIYLAALTRYFADTNKAPATDDTYVYAAYTERDVAVVPASARNIKITTKDDIALFEALRKEL